jgi:LDH2 family malate/lactate/ureidoglycolate dehydrogenase
MVEILSAVLPGVRTATRDAADVPRVGHFFLALDPERFRTGGDFGLDLDALARGLRATPPLDAATPVRVAGDPERAAAQARRATGVPLPRAVLEDLRHVARASGAPFLLDGGAGA